MARKVGNNPNLSTNSSIGILSELAEPTQETGLDFT